MNRNWSQNGHMHRRGNFWIFALILLGLIILTHGWILFLPLMLLMVVAGFVFFGFILPRIMWHMHDGDWHHEDWAARWHEKRMRHFQDWDDEPRRKHDDIEYV